MTASTSRVEPPSRLLLWQHAVIFLLASAVIISRRPDAILHAQFYAEDGHVWFADAYNLGWWSALFQTYAGYFVLLPRLAASVALLVPLSLVPLTLNLIAIPFQVLPANLLLSSRSSGWGNLRSRALMVAIYLALPNCYELFWGITDANWLLVLSAFILLVASTPRSAAAKVFDIGIMLLSGLTGPFSIFLFPISIFLAKRSRDRWRWVPACVLGSCCLIQGWTLLTAAASGRPHSALGASPALFARIVTAQIFFGTLIGSNGLSLLRGNSALIFVACATVFGFSLVAFCFFTSSLEMKLFLLFSETLLVASLIAPTVNPPAGASVWEILAVAPNIRYWFFPELAFAWSLLWCSRSRNNLLKIASTALLFVTCIGIIRDWRHPSFPEEHLPDYAKRFESAKTGATVIIPLYPEGWTMKLVKHP
jgi:hypothetical protein